MGQIVSGFVEETSSDYASAQLIGWDVVDFSWAHHFKHDFLPRSCDFELTPNIIARLPLLGARGFPYAKNTDISNIVRLELPLLDLPIWRERAAVAGTARVSNFLWSDNNSLLGPVPEGPEEALISVSEAGSPRSKTTQILPPQARSPPKNNRHMQIPKAKPPLFKAPPRWEDSVSLHDRPASIHRSRREIEYFDIARSSKNVLY